MKKLIFFLVLIGLLFVASASFAQTAKVVRIEGSVLVKEDAGSTWRKAKINEFLNKEAELVTKARSECTLAFDEEMKNILTVSENSQIKLESIKPGNVFLNRGRVFSLVEGLAPNEKFEVRTPVAIAGARGTGWITEHDKVTRVRVFERLVKVLGLDETGNTTEEKDVGEGFGIIIDPKGLLQMLFDLKDFDYEEWEGFLRDWSTLWQEPDDLDDFRDVEDMRNEARESFREFLREKERSEQEDSGGNNYFLDVAQ